jgi:hypothetical protein
MVRSSHGEKQMQQSFRNMATRAVNAENSFAASLVEIAGITTEEAFRVLATYRKIKVVKNDYAVSRISVKHGGFLDRDVILRALEQSK